jgi:chemotaxis protein methyltransferase CheR
MVEFRQLNLAGSWPPLPRLDVVLLRNVMVYFRDSTKQHVLRQVRRQMKPDGYLFLGGAETTLLLDPAFARLQHAGFSYYRLHGQHRP